MIAILQAIKAGRRAAAEIQGDVMNAPPLDIAPLATRPSRRARPRATPARSTKASRDFEPCIISQMFEQMWLGR